MFYSAFVVFSATCDLTIFHMSNFCRLLITFIKQKTACSFLHLPCFYFMLYTVIALTHFVTAVCCSAVRHKLLVGETVVRWLFLSQSAIFFVLWNLKVYHCVQKIPPFVTVLSWISRVDMPSPIMLSQHTIFKRYILILSSHLCLGLKVASSG